jgi:predicted permease
MLERLQSLPGVRTASMARFPPISGGSGTNFDFTIPAAGAGQTLAREVWVNNVGPKYFKAMGVPIIAGREFEPRDSTRPGSVVIVNEAFARRYFGETSPIGKTITQREIPMEIIGLVGNAKFSELRGDMEETVYYDLFRQWGVPMQFLIRTEDAPEMIAATVQSEIRSVFGNVLIQERTLQDRIDASIVRERLVSRLAVVFGGLALLLAVIGLYGVVSNSVARRTREIGIRMALGFERREAVLMVLREVVLLAAAGLLLGLPLAWAAGRFVMDLLYGLTPDDPLNVVAAVSVLLFATFAAGFIPARRAARVDPMVALRGE